MISPRIACLFALGLLGAHSLFALPVFPGAVGFGAHTVAGRGGQVYRVTNLNDSGPGSLRFGVEQIQGPRVIVFEVSGVIELQSDLEVRPKNAGEYGRLTIAGQTAPPPGITLKNAGISIRGEDVLIQHIAIRPGTSLEFPRLPRLLNRDAIKIHTAPGEAAARVMIDHVSCSWAVDETVSTWGTLEGEGGSVHDVTFQNCIFAQPIHRADPSGVSGYGPLAGRNSVNISFIANLMAFNPSRNPLLRDTLVNAQVINNFIYRPGPWGNSAIYLGYAHPDFPDLTLTASIAGNVIIRSPELEWDGKQASKVSTTGIYVHDQVSTNTSVYFFNNSVFNPVTGVWHPTDGNPFSPEIYRAGPVELKTWSSEPYPFTGVVPSKEKPEVIEAERVRTAGKQPAFRDAIDRALMEQIAARTGTWIVRMEELGENPWAPADIRQTRPLELPSNPNGDDDNDGYTNLEEWLHAWSAYVEGTADRPPASTGEAIAQLAEYQTPAVENGMPVFFQKLKDRMTHPLSWTSGKFDDFAAWKKQAREQVRLRHLNPPPAAPWNPVVIGEEDRGSYVARKLVFNITADSRVAAYLTVPKGQGPFPAVLVLHDHGGRYEIGKEKVVRPWGAPPGMAEASEIWVKRLYGGRHIADELSKRGYVCFVTDAINWGERGGGGVRGQEVLASNMMHLGMSFAGTTAWEDQRAAEFLAEQPEVDARRIAAMGLSMGAYRTWQVAGMSDRIVAGVAICYMGTVGTVLTPGMNHTKGSSAYSMLHPGLLAELDYPDLASLACPKPMLFYSGRYDRIFPQSGVNEAFAKMRAVWASQDASSRLETKTWAAEHVFDVEMQEAAFAWLDRMMARLAE